MPGSSAASPLPAFTGWLRVKRLVTPLASSDRAGRTWRAPFLCFSTFEQPSLTPPRASSEEVISDLYPRAIKCIFQLVKFADLSRLDSRRIYHIQSVLSLDKDQGDCASFALTSFTLDVQQTHNVNWLLIRIISLMKE